MNKRHEIFENETHTFELEYTDTFGGETNYAWVKRATISFDKPYTDRQLMLRAKEALGLTGVRCNVTDFGDSIQLDPIGMCTRAFISFQY